MNDSRRLTQWLDPKADSGATSQAPGASKGAKVVPLTNLQWCVREAERMRGVCVCQDDDGKVALYMESVG